MNYIDMGRDWLLADKNAQESACCPIPKGKAVNLPFDALTVADRDFDADGGAFNGYYAPSSVVLYKLLPDFESGARVILDVWGAGGIAEFFVNGEPVGAATDSHHFSFDITDKLSRKSGANVVKCVVTSCTATGKYTGLGLGGARVYSAAGSAFIEPSGVYVNTTAIDKKAFLTASVTVFNRSDELKTFVLRAEVLNRKGKRVIKKVRKIKLKPHANKAFELKLRMSRHYDWTAYDPYLYSFKASVHEIEGEELKELDSHTESFGVRTFAYTGKVFKLNNQPVKLKGVVMAHDNGILGAGSELGAELYKLRRVKEMGFNAVRYIGCPSDNALTAMDMLGLMSVVDIFGTFKQGAFTNDGHLNFEVNRESIIKRCVQALRNHPSVVLYSAVNDAPESYGRGAGYGVLDSVVSAIKRFDPYRPVTANVFERPLLRAEAERLGIRCTSDAAVAKAAEEKNVFRTLTDKFFEKVDFASYSGLHRRFAVDKDRMILGLSSSVEEFYESFEETDKNTNVLGNFIAMGADFIGNTAPVTAAPRTYGNGLLDKTYNFKKSAVYARTVLDKKFVSSIWVMNPAELAENPEAEPRFENMSQSWNWNAYVGKPVKVRVYSNTEIIALYLDGKVISRKLAGRFNRFYAEFKLYFYPGKLEAVGFYKGAEVSRTVLETTGTPRALKLEPSQKVLKENDLCFVNVLVKDRDGRLLSNVDTNKVKITVEGEGELVAFSNGDNTSFAPASDDVQSLFAGRATAVVRAKQAGKIIVKATGEGLLSNKTRIRVK